MDADLRSLTLKEEEGEEFQREMMMMQEATAALVPKSTVPEQSSDSKFIGRRKWVPRAQSPPHDRVAANQVWEVPTCISKWKEIIPNVTRRVVIHVAQEEAGVEEQEIRELIKMRSKIEKKYKMQERARMEQEVEAIIAKAEAAENNRS